MLYHRRLSEHRLRSLESVRGEAVGLAELHGQMVSKTGLVGPRDGFLHLMLLRDYEIVMMASSPTAAQLPVSTSRPLVFPTNVCTASSCNLQRGSTADGSSDRALLAT